MWRRERLLVGLSLTAFAGVALVCASVLWVLWLDSIATEEETVGGLAASIGERAERAIVDTRDLLGRFDRLAEPRCSTAHLKAMEEAAASRPYLRAIGHWRAAERLCGVGFLQTNELKPARADRIYESGVVAWWPGPQTEVGGVPLFLMRFGDHDAAIDPRLLLEIGPLEHRQVALWVENLRFATQPIGADLPVPDALPVGVHVDREAGQVVSRFSRDLLLPIDVVATEPIGTFYGRQTRTLAVGSAIGLALAGIWLVIVLRYSRQRLSLAAELGEALARGHIGVQYQPIVDLATGRYVGAEALARWTRGNGESIAPDVFIPIAEQAGLVSSITLSLLDTVIRDLRFLEQTLPGLSINLNLSAEDLRNDLFADALASRLEGAGLPAHAIKLEITERALVHGEVARRLIRTFRDRGHEVAVDDFGTGYSSLSYLETFELDTLKIDKSFVEGIDTPGASGQVVSHIIEMSRSLGLATLAEGVETEAQRRWLVARGVRYGQGYLFSRPLDAAELGERLREERAA